MHNGTFRLFAYTHRIIKTVRRETTVLGASLCFAAVMAQAEAGAQPRETFQAREPSWPERSIGTPFWGDTPRPRDEVGVLRSLRAPVSVHVGPGVAMDDARRTLALAEETLDTLEFTLRLTPPLADGCRGGDPGTDVYLSLGGPTFETVAEALDPGALQDRASAFVRVRTTSDAGELRRRLAEGLARAAVLGVNADHARPLWLALSASIAHAITLDAPDFSALAAFQQDPWRALVLGRDDASARGAAQWVDYMQASADDETHRLLGGLVAATMQKTPRGWERLWNEPDVFDLAQRVYRDEAGGIAGMLLSESVARVVDAEIPARASRTLRYAELPAVVEGPPTEPTGMALVDINLDTAPLNAALGVWVHASPWRRWIATVLRFDREQRMIRSLDSGLIVDGEWSVTLDQLDGITRATVVLVDLGDEAYDPDLPGVARAFWRVHVAPRP